MANTDRQSSGKRDRLVTIEARPVEDAVDSEGGPIDGPWAVLVADMPAAKVEASGHERFLAAQTSAPLETRWEINYRADMAPDLIDVAKLRRLVVAGRVHDITGAIEIGRRRGIELRTLAKVG